MVKLNSKEVNDSWEEFRDHLVDCGMLIDEELITVNNLDEKRRHNLVKTAYKQGFVSGARMKTESNGFITENAIPLKYTPKESIIHKKRTRQIIKDDNEILESVLRENIEPMPLSDLIKIMKIRGRIHWNNNNASSYIRTAINDGCKIEKVDYGLYAYDFGGSKQNGDSL